MSEVIALMPFLILSYCIIVQCEALYLLCLYIHARYPLCFVKNHDLFSISLASCFHAVLISPEVALIPSLPVVDHRFYAAWVLS